MAAELVLGLAVGSAALYIGWRRIRVYGEYWRYQHKADAFEKSMKLAREELAADRVIRAVGAGDSEMVEIVDMARVERSAIEACGFTMLGDVVVDVPGKHPTAILRAFVDKERTTCAYLAVHGNHTRIRRLALATYHGDEMYTTRRNQAGTLAEPPFVHRLSLENGTAYSKLLEEHRKFAKLDGARRIESLDAVVEMLANIRARTVQWRGGLSPDELLDLDLRAVLGKQYDKLGKLWTRRLRERLPEATLHRN